MTCRWRNCEELMRCCEHGAWDDDCDALEREVPEWKELAQNLQLHLDLADTVVVFGLAQSVTLVISIVDMKAGRYRYRLTRHQKIAVSYEEYDGLAALEAALRTYEGPVRKVPA